MIKKTLTLLLACGLTTTHHATSHATASHAEVQSTTATPSGHPSSVATPVAQFSSSLQQSTTATPSGHPSSVATPVAQFSSPSTAPNWQINATTYEFSMLVTAVAIIDSVELRHPDDRVAAFSGGQLCGVASPVYIEAINRNIFYLMVMSNSSSTTEEIRFKIYNATTGQITDGINSMTFERNKATGSAQSPWIISNINYTEDPVTPNRPPTAIHLSNTTIAENQPAGTLVGVLSTEDPDSNEQFTYRIISTGLPFSIEGNQLKSTAPFNYELQKTYQLSIEVTDRGNHTLQRSFSIQVTDQNDPPVLIGITGDTVISGLPSGITIGILYASDEDPDDQVQFSLPTGVADNHLFSVHPTNGLLKTAATISNTPEQLTLQVELTDQSQGTSRTAVTLTVQDLGIRLIANELHITLAIADTATQVCYVDGHAISIQLLPYDSYATLQVKSDTPINSYSLYNIQGMLLRQETVGDYTFLLRAHQYPIGTYLLHLETAKGKVTRKIVISALVF
jgi:hypothetical protein